MFARAGDRQVERVSFVRTVGDAVFGDDRAPCAAVYANVGTFDDACAVIGHSNQAASARLNFYRDLGGLRVQRVFHELLDEGEAHACVAPASAVPANRAPSATPLLAASGSWPAPRCRSS